MVRSKLPTTASQIATWRDGGHTVYQDREQAFNHIKRARTFLPEDEGNRLLCYPDLHHPTRVYVALRPKEESA